MWLDAWGQFIDSFSGFTVKSGTLSLKPSPFLRYKMGLFPKCMEEYIGSFEQTFL